MAPRISKKDRGEPPKPVVKAGTLGFYPVKPIALSYLYGGMADVVVGQKDADETLYLKEHPNLTFQEGQNNTTFSTAGKVYNGFSDAFYRGMLPQTFVAMPDVGSVNHFIDEFLDYFEKLVSLGFFLSKNTLLEPAVDPVDQLVPCFVVASHGIFYGNIIRKMNDSLSNIPSVSDAMRQKVLSRFTRGIMSPGEQPYFQKGKPIEPEPARSIKIAGGNAGTQKTIVYILRAHGLEVSLEDRVENPVERLELENALWRVFHGILPALNQDGQISSKEVQEYQTRIKQTVKLLGRHIKAFEEQESMEAVLSDTSGFSPKSGMTRPSLMPGDSTLLGSLSRFAETLHLEEEKESLQLLKHKVLEQLKHL